MADIPKPTIWPILMADDEWSDVSDLEDVLDKASTAIYTAYENDMEHFPYNIPIANLRQYSANPEEALDYLLEYQRNNHRFSAIISDNHMKSEEGLSISGDDFLRIISGKLIYCLTKNSSDEDYGIEAVEKWDSFDDLYDSLSVDDEEVQDFMEKFEDPQNYASFVNYFFGNQQNPPALILLCGNPREADLTGLDDLFIVQKQTRKVRKGIYQPCENEILNHLIEKGIFPREFIEPHVKEHPRLGDNVHPNNRLFKDPKKKRKSK
jgi:hypothetical protein